jgi:hypothetical protein
MLSHKIRHYTVALGLVALAGLTGASAAGFVHNGRAPAQGEASRPVPAGELPEVVVHAPHDLGEITVHVRRDLGHVLVTAGRAPAATLAEVVVTVPRDARAGGGAGLARLASAR